MNKKNNCKHEDGWIVKEEFTIDDEYLGNNDDIVVECECNTIGCNARRKFKFDIILVEKIKEAKK